ncbi:MAG: hypothetical protein FJX47_11740, partial [Alphaproteobacteria bacterium]|nr:hypothetical protein [Alphaproteobacteria bacterium]
MFSISRFAVDLGRSGRFLASLGALLGCLAAFSAEGHSGHDHGAAGPKGASSAAPIMGLAAAEGEVFQVVLAMSEDGTPEFLIADAETNAPVNGARVVVETTSGPIGEAQPVAAGRYILHEGWPEDAHDFVVMILGGGRGDLILVRHV